MTGYTSWRLPVYAALGAVGLVAGLALGRVEPVALAAPFLLALVAGLAMHEPDVSVRVSLDRDRAIEGDEVTATILLSSTRGADRFELFVPLPAGLEGPARAVRLRAGEEQTIELQFRCDHWGVFSVGKVLLRARDMLGLRSWEGEAGEARPLRVFPREETLRSLIAPLETQVFAGNQVSRARGEGIEFADLREWQPGDRLRRVNWRATALRGSLWVNEQNPERNTDVVLFLDTFAEVRAEGRSTNDRAVRAAATLARIYLQRKDRVGLVGFGGFLSWLVPASGMRQLYAIVETLLTTEVVHSFALRGVDVLPPRTLPPKALVLAITPLLDNRTAAALLDLRARGYDLIVVEVSPVELVAPEPGSSLELAHRLWRLSREALRWRYEQVGVPVVTWREGEPLAVPIEEVNAFRHLARPA
ncbi:MAG: DUF58 domain-containing protein [Actinobacteria bacterium]|nr:MAG: DUF58 domain-containing protein [Actinomycetota bacterium]